MPLHKSPFSSQPTTDLAAFLNQVNVGQTKNELLEIKAPPQQVNNYRKVLAFYGVHTDQIGDEFVGDCPFEPCKSEAKTGKFTMNTQTGMFRCFVCGQKGNTFTFIRSLHEHYYNQTTQGDLERLAARRGNAIDLWMLEEMQVALNRATNEWLLPSWSTDGASKGLCNLYAWKQSYDEKTAKPYMQILSGPTFKHVPYGIHRLRSGTNRPLWVLEGHWDYMAFGSLLHRLGDESRHDYIAAPGVDTFPKQFVNIFNGREVVLAYDNDIAGRNGMESLMKLMAGHGVYPQSLSVLVWPTDLQDKFDVSDAIVKLPKNHWKGK